MSKLHPLGLPCLLLPLRNRRRGQEVVAVAESTNYTGGHLGMLDCVAERLGGLVSQPVALWLADK